MTKAEKLIIEGKYEAAKTPFDWELKLNILQREEYKVKYETAIMEIMQTHKKIEQWQKKNT